MKIFSKIFFLGILTTLIINFPVYSSSIKEMIEEYVEDIPGIGLISDSINFNGITIRDFRFDNDKKYIFVKPEEEFSTHFKYAIDASQLETLHLHHFIIGLYKDGPQKCVLHTLGLINAEGDADIVLKAPEKEGVYQVRFCHSEGLTYDEARKAWEDGEGASSKTIVGIVVVK